MPKRWQRSDGYQSWKALFQRWKRRTRSPILKFSAPSSRVALASSLTPRDEGTRMCKRWQNDWISKIRAAIYLVRVKRSEYKPCFHDTDVVRMLCPYQIFNSSNFHS